jgi:hypothetical protein
MVRVFFYKPILGIQGFSQVLVVLWDLRKNQKKI